MFGPDATERTFMTNGLSLVLRSHEGPDARGTENMPDMDGGFKGRSQHRGGRKAVHGVQRAGLPAVHRGGRAAAFQQGDVRGVDRGGRATPAPVAFTAAKPRPNSQPYYDITVGGSTRKVPTVTFE